MTFQERQARAKRDLLDRFEKATETMINRATAARTLKALSDARAIIERNPFTGAADVVYKQVLMANGASSDLLTEMSYNLTFLGVPIF